MFLSQQLKVQSSTNGSLVQVISVLYHQCEIPTNENSVIIYSPSSLSKTVWLLFLLCNVKKEHEEEKKSYTFGAAQIITEISFLGNLYELRVNFCCEH